MLMNDNLLACYGFIIITLVSIDNYRQVGHDVSFHPRRTRRPFRTASPGPHADRGHAIGGRGRWPTIAPTFAVACHQFADTDAAG